jgi:hypothetical protein
MPGHTTRERERERERTRERERESFALFLFFVCCLVLSTGRDDWLSLLSIFLFVFLASIRSCEKSS